MNTIEFISYFLFVSKTPETIQNKSDYIRAKRWKNRASFLYLLATAAAVVFAFAVLGNPSLLPEDIDLPQPLIYVAIPFVAVFFAWGVATMLLNLKLMIKSLWGATVAGYHTGEQIQRTTYNVTREYNNSYKVTTETENEGCAVAMIYWFINLCVWCFLCIYVCPFLTFGKINKTKAVLRRYKQAMR